MARPTARDNTDNPSSEVAGRDTSAAKVASTTKSRAQELIDAGGRKIAEGVLRTPDGKFWISDQRGGFSETNFEGAQSYAERRANDGFLGIGDSKREAQVRTQFARERVREDNENEDRFANVRPEMADIEADPYAIESQKRALAGIAEYGRGGLRESDKQAIQAGQMQQGQYLRGQREAGIDQAEMRGMRGGAGQLASDIGAQQGMANALFMQNADINNAASDRALQALGMQGSAAQGMRRDSFAEAGVRAGSADNWRQGEIGEARRQRDIRLAQANAEQARHDAAPTGTEQVLGVAAPVLDVAAVAGGALAGAPVPPGAVSGALTPAQRQPGIQQAPAGSPHPPAGFGTAPFKNPYAPEDKDEWA